jgi:hypothetical protein
MQPQPSPAREDGEGSAGGPNAERSSGARGTNWAPPPPETGKSLPSGSEQSGTSETIAQLATRSNESVRSSAYPKAGSLRRAGCWVVGAAIGGIIAFPCSTSSSMSLACAEPTTAPCPSPCYSAALPVL